MVPHHRAAALASSAGTRRRPMSTTGDGAAFAASARRAVGGTGGMANRGLRRRPPPPRVVANGGNDASSSAAVLRRVRLLHHRQRAFSTSSRQQQQQQHQQRAADDSWAANARIASYAAAVAIGALGATYASVPLYKIFCQATGFGGTTQRVALEDYVEDMEGRADDGGDGGGDKSGGGGSARVSKISSNLMDKLYSMSNVPGLTRSSGGGAHQTWTDEEAAARLASLKPSESGRLIRVTFDSTVGDVLPWTFVPTQPSVRVVPGETALCFFSTTNTSDRAITGVATYNVYPPKAGLYFNKIQCFCFEEQRLLPGETVDMPVFFFLDPEYENDAGLRRCNNITLSYTFFQTDVDDDDDDDDEEEVEENVAKAR